MGHKETPMKHGMAAPWRWWNWLYNHYAREVTAGIALLVVLLAVATALNDRANARQDHIITEQTAQRTNDNSANAVTSCENANESREASRTLWNFVLDLTSTNADATAGDIAYLGQVRIWVNEIYQQHDCDDLGRAYPLPPPPTIPGR